MGFVKSDKRQLLAWIIGIIVILFGVVGIVEYIPSIRLFLKDPFALKFFTSRKLSKDILLFLNLNLFVALVSYILFIISGTMIFKRKQKGIRMLFIVSLVYLIFFIIHDLFFLPLTLDSIEMIIASKSPLLFIKNLEDNFGYIFFSIFFIIVSRFVKFEN